MSTSKDSLSSSTSSASSGSSSSSSPTAVVAVDGHSTTTTTTPTTTTTTAATMNTTSNTNTNTNIKSSLDNTNKMIGSKRSFSQIDDEMDNKSQLQSQLQSQSQSQSQSQHLSSSSALNSSYSNSNKRVKLQDENSTTRNNSNKTIGNIDSLSNSNSNPNLINVPTTVEGSGEKDKEKENDSGGGGGEGEGEGGGGGGRRRREDEIKTDKAEKIEQTEAQRDGRGRIGGGEEDDEQEEEIAPGEYLKMPRKIGQGHLCPYLDQIDRKALDFDFEKVCSESMFNHNVYGCLVCGQYFAGRAKGSPAYFHALQENHRIFIHLDNGKIYCLPEDYEVIDPSLNDIKHNLHPKFSGGDITNLDTRVDYVHALDGRDYLPGVIGMNNLSNTDWLNVVFQSLMRVKPIRNFFIDENNYQDCTSVLVRRFGELVRKYFNAKNFKGQVSPHELLQAISKQSDKKFQIGNRADPLAFLAWFLDSLHRDLGGYKSKKGSIISKTFHGAVGIETYTPITEDNKTSGNTNTNTNTTNSTPTATNTPTKNNRNEKYSITYEKKPFFYILLDLPPMPLFKDGQQEKFIPQIPLTELLNKFNNETEELLPSGGKKKYRIVKLPTYLIIAFRRFQENNFFVEKNATIVNFVLMGLDLSTYLFPVDCDKDELNKLSVTRLKQKLRRLGGSTAGIIDKEQLIEEIIDHFPPRRKWKTKYDLVANVCHDGEYDSGSNRVFIYHQNNRNWYEMQDLHVQERMPQLVAVSEAYIQFWKKSDVK